MAYNAPSDEQQRPYRGNAAQPPTPRGYQDNGQSQQPYSPPENYGNYGNDYNNSQGHMQGGQGDYFGQHTQQPSGGRGPQNRYPQGHPQGRGQPPPGPGPRGPSLQGGPPRGGISPPRGRGMPGPGGRGGMSRGGGPGPGPGPGHYGPGNERYDARRPPPPQDQGAMRPPPNADRRRSPPNQGDYMAERMASMDLNRQPDSRSSGSQQPQGSYGYGPSSHNQSPPQQGGPRPAPGYSQDDQSQAYPTPGPPRDHFPPPTRSVTMPITQNASHDGGVLYNGPAGKTGFSKPAPPQQAYDGPANNNYGNAPYDQSNSYASDVYDSYYDNSHDTGYDQSSHQPQPSQSSAYTYPGPSQHSAHESQHSQAGAHQVPQLNDARSMAEYREPQSAVFEMVGDAPSIPPMPQQQQQQQHGNGYDAGYSQAPSYGNMAPPVRGPSAPPATMRGSAPAGYGSYPGINRPGTSVSQRTTASADFSHPVPVRPGQMPNSLVNPNNRPPPVRNYGGLPSTQQQAPQPYQQQQPQQQYQNQNQAVPQQQMQPAPNNQGGTPPNAEPPVTTQELEQLRLLIKNNPNDQEAALKLAKRLIEASTVLVSNLPDPRARAKACERYLMDAYKVLKKLANAQNQEAMFLLADSLGRGLFGNEPDGKEAFTLYQSAAKLGHAGAAYRTAVCCEIGNDEGGGTRKDPLKAMQWYKRAATLGDTPAMYKIGMILLKGHLGQNRNPREAVGWLKRAAERADADNPHALHELGLLFESARPDDAIVRDEAYALRLFQEAADLGYKFSQFRLGCAYEYGLMGCPIDPRLSIVWYSKAAMQEEHQSELALSGWYLTGSDNVLGQSDTEAYLWARKAAVAGLPKAEYAMGYFTEVGIGIPPNLEDAKRWYWRAAAQEFPRARERLEDLKRMGKNVAPRPRERFSRSRTQEGDCVIM
ncbi:Putative Tetratricopeptide-like helical [[Torrubiella] hemipterigena]|uniref:Putative Tetratricopeptide-like helical n=1 Tax=[Torrubiella] hemipterigena TaxID=1531966 RepID=A0A0A1T236_9HYPO|nr:Putative Tetratricopeptide-like helical [[Torrubiella] hemipterigena]